MLDPALAAAAFANVGITHWYGVPDSVLSALIVEIVGSPATDTVTTANEGAAVAAAAGHFLATGEIAGVYLQNSGVGNALNPLVSLAHRDVYSIPMVLVIGWRGYPGTTDEPQHVAQGLATRTMLEAAGLTVLEISSNPDLLTQEIQGTYDVARTNSAPVALLVPPGLFPKPHIPQPAATSQPTREAAIEAVLDAIPSDAVVLATTGKTGRELFELRVARQEESASDFLNVGAMGHAIAVALGMAIARPDRAIVLLDGDGAAAMHLGSQLTVANSAPPNLMHILFNNRAHESVGGQSTELSASDLSHVALAAGYRSAGTVDTLAGLSDTVSAGITDDGPVFIEALIQAGSRSDLGRPTVSRKDSRDEIRRKFDQ